MLKRINRELNANFILDKFDHYPLYDPDSGTTYSYLRSLENQDIKIGGYKVHFNKNELLHTEVSQKYALEDIDQLKKETGFRTVNHFLDSKSYFSVSVFKK